MALRSTRHKLHAVQPSPANDTIEPAVIVIAHGSRSIEANDAHRVTCRELAEQTGTPVTPAFLELAEPSLTTAVDALATAGIRRVRVLPLFLYPGRHMQRDIPALVAEAADAHPEVEIELLPLFGSDPGLIHLLAAQVQR